MQNLSFLGKITIFEKSLIKHDTLCNDYENGGLKSVDTFSKIAHNALGLEYYMMKTFIPGK